MDKETKSLYVFGYGLPLLVSFLLSLHTFNLLGWAFVFALLAGFAGVMWLTVIISTWKPLYNLWVLCVLVGVTLFRFQHGEFGLLTGAIIGFSLMIGVAAINDVQKIKPIYDVWMRGARFISLCITTVLLTVMYYVIFTPLGLIYRLMGEQPIDRQWGQKTTTAWHQREDKPFDPASYGRQF